MSTAPQTAAARRAPALAPQVARRRWPLLAIGASAGTAVWSGWVGLGELTGFGVVRPLPGIANGFAINTAVTLPIGVEAYAMYALSIATSGRALPVRTRRYAWGSSAAALLLGMAGQVAYHVMTAYQPAQQQPEQVAGTAPWWVIALVSCLPVLVLGAASLLWHFAGETDPGYEPPESRPGRVLRAVVEASTEHAASTGYDPRPEYEGEHQNRAPARPGPRARPNQVTPGRRRSSTRTARPDDVARVRAAIATGDLPPVPTVQAIRDLLGIGSAYASATRDAITHDPDRQDVDAADLSTAPIQTDADISLNGHAFTAESTRSGESPEPTTGQPEHMTEALFTDHPAQPFSSTTHDLKPVSK